MLNTYYTYRALAREWSDLLAGDSVAGIYSSRKRELSLELASGSVLVFGVRRSLRYLFRAVRSGRPRKNVAELLGDAAGARITNVRVAERDRVMHFDLAGGRDLRFYLFGSRPNVLLVEGGHVLDAFKEAARHRGSAAPASRPAGRSVDEADFVARARKAATAAGAVTSAFPLFDRVMAEEVLHRAGVGAGTSVEEALEVAERLYETALQVEREAESSPSGRMYVSSGGEIVFSLIALGHTGGFECREFDDVDSSVSECTRRVLRQMQFDEEIGPVRRALGDRLQSAERRLREVSEHIERPGRADHWERCGHLLMASGRGDETGLEKILVPDHFGTGEPVSIPLDASLSVVENAQDYYARARRSRASLQAAVDRVERTRSEVEVLQQTAAELESVVDLDGLRSFMRVHDDLSGARAMGGDAASRPFRRYALGEGFEVWVGRNAKENDELTFGHARKFDIWMHARGVGGSHAVLRLPGRGVRPGASVLEAAASVAAYYSKARGSELVPVMYTERKYVRKPRGGDAGKVVVDREDVLIVRPVLPRG